MSLPTMYCSHTLRGVWSILLLCMRTRSVCTGVALPFLVPRTPQVLILLMAALMILGIKMLAIRVMPRNHDPGDHGCRTSFCFFVVQGLCVSATRTLHCSSCGAPCMQCGCTHSFSSSLMAALMILGSRDWPSSVMTRNHDLGDHG